MTAPLLEAMTHKALPKGGVAALGNFDGVHLGHRDVVRAAVLKAKELGLSAYATTFHPHPYLFFQKEKKPFRLTPFNAKIRLLKEAGADEVVALPFTPEMAAMSAEDFIDRVLVETLEVKHVAVGFNFVFGAGKRGTDALLKEKLEPLGIGVTEVPPRLDASDDVISSSRIRAALAAGELANANAMLGRPFSIEGEIIHGQQRGRLLGMPTANIALGDYVRPLFGVYAVLARRAGEAVFFPGVANIGLRPTIGDHQELLEFHILDFDGDLYGQHWEVELRVFLRPEKKFSGLDELKTHMQLDKEAAKQALKA